MSAQHNWTLEAKGYTGLARRAYLQGQGKGAQKQVDTPFLANRQHGILLSNLGNRESDILSSFS
jgi:hypothetical protein